MDAKGRETQEQLPKAFNKDSLNSYFSFKFGCVIFAYIYGCHLLMAFYLSWWSKLWGAS
jgi:hypothetical protein